MALHLTGLSPEDLAEVVDCLLLGADQTANTVIAERRRHIAHGIGDALDALPTTEGDDQ
ncbi:hypothetical protein PV620_30120 [Streptomyces sp. ME02-6978a]|uniref:hypothetical protein n=1 Tax=unclassified Streptomyces TaxID=2593676 RepID=UPI0029B8B7FF|nr:MULTISPECIES: hypothetical protein [unclassified Streptomyces]MDX3087161.1 hypothetical protein [Streptomyces sp. ME12-02E]MDX3335804.1 hypothetical protein [Streptomyces sp. ME02-6978a]